MRPGKKLVWRAVSYGVGAAAALATRMALTKAWRGLADSSPPQDPGDRSVPLSRALIWMIAVSVGMGITRALAVRSAATVWEAATDEPPPV